MPQGAAICSENQFHFGVNVMSQKSLELRQKRSALIAEMHDLTEKTSFAGEAEARWNSLDAEQKSLEKQINAIESTEGLRSEMEKVTHVEKTQPGTETREVKLTNEEQRAKKYSDLRGSEAYKRSFDNWLRSGRKDSTFSEAAELRTYSGLEASTGVGENIVPIGFQKEVDIKLKAYGGMRRNARIINTSAGNTLQWPIMDDVDTQTGEWTAENGTVGQGNPSFSQVTFTSNVADSKQVLVSVQLLQDSAFDVQSLLTDAFGVRIGRTINNGYTVGNGSGQPNGLIPQLTSNYSGQQVLANGAASNNSTSSYSEINSVGTDDLGNLIAQLDPAYRPNAKFMANQNTIDFLRKVKDGFGHPMWTSSVASSIPDKIFGYDYDWNQDMATIAATNVSMVFGDFSHYVIRDVGPLTTVVFQELYMASLQKGYLAFLRTDGQLLQGAAFSYLQHRDS
jgi:HK97 family phage major capsid protein